MNTALINEYSGLKPIDTISTSAARPAGVQAAAEQRAPERPREPQPANDGPMGLRDFTMKFEVDRDSGEVVVSIVDPKTGDLLRQIPSEDALKLAKALESIGKTFLRDQA